ncbi:MAG: hypothetical protein D6696_16725, partial [Acidobacteria bacterium]
PGAASPPVEPPPFVASPPPQPWPGRHPADPPPADAARAARAWQALQEGEDQIAAGLYKRLADATPRSWSLRYNLGIALLRSGLYRDAARALGDAVERLAEHPPVGGEAAHRAMVIATRYAAADALSPDDCPAAIQHLKLAVGELRRYLAASDEPAFNRDLPFAVAPSALSSHQVRNRLAQEYLSCGTYPEEYFRRRLGSHDFRTSEYRDATLAEVREGPFPQQLAACVASNGATARCWALSNLNRLYWANRDLYPREDEPPAAAYAAHWDDLARLAINVAILAAESPEEEERRGAGRYLRQARRLDRASDEIDLGSQIDVLGRALAGMGDNSALAEPYRGLPLDRLPFAEADTMEEIKGLAQAFREGLENELAGGRPERLPAAFDAARAALPGPHLEALARYRREVETALQEALASALRDARRRGDLETALALRRLRAPYLGEGWPARAQLAWLAGGAGWRVTLIALAWLLFTAGLVLLRRYVVYPYLLYTADYYRSEWHERYRRRREAGLAMTGDEVQRRLRARARR